MRPHAWQLRQLFSQIDAIHRLFGRFIRSTSKCSELKLSFPQRNPYRCVIRDGAASGYLIGYKLFVSAVRAGYPNSADDLLEAEVDLHGHVVKRPAATFFVRSKGDSIIGDGISTRVTCHRLVVDRSLEPFLGRIIIIAADGGLTVKRLERVGKRAYLRALLSRSL